LPRSEHFVTQRFDIGINGGERSINAKRRKLKYAKVIEMQGCEKMLPMKIRNRKSSNGAAQNKLLA